jgi:uncharacterized protein YggE
MVRIAAAVFVALLVAAPAVPAAAQDMRPGATLSISGDGSVGVVPDIAIINVGVVVEAKTATEALTANTAAMEKVIAALKGAGIAERDLGTSGFTVNPVYSTPQPKPDGTTPNPAITGYQVANQLRVVIRDLAKAGDILDLAVGAGANQVNSISFDISDRQKSADEATAKAIAEAQRKAKLIADAAGVKLVRIVSISANEAYQAFQSTAADMRKAVPILPGESQLAVNVQIVWEIGQ